MKRKIIYRSVDVQQVRVAELLPLLVAGCIVAMDVAKEKFVVALATLAGEVVKLVRFQHPTQTRAFLAVVEELRAALGADKVVAAMEPTGTYGDAVRLQLVRAGVPVHMVSPKRTHDSKELFDGVPSLHDPKSAVLVAKLESMQLSTPWSEPPATRVRLRALVDARQHQRTRSADRIVTPAASSATLHAHAIPTACLSTPTPPLRGGVGPTRIRSPAGQPLPRGLRHLARRPSRPTPLVAVAPRRHGEPPRQGRRHAPRPCRRRAQSAAGRCFSLGVAGTGDTGLGALHGQR